MSGPAAAVIFDMDGTLLRLDVDIEEVRLRLAALFAPYGVTRPFRPILARIRAAAGEAAGQGPGATEARAALERQGFAILDEWELRGAASARPRDGAVAAVDALAARGVGLGLVTDNGRACVAPALARAGFSPARFAAIVTRDDVPRAKPDPAGVAAAATALAAPTVWYVGDHPRDVEAGRAAVAAVPGLRVAALTGGHASEADLRRAQPDAVLTSLGDVLGLLDG